MKNLKKAAKSDDVIKKIKVEQMMSPNGNYVANQLLIWTDSGVYFQSYNSIIAFKSGNNVSLDCKAWDFSQTTGKYRNIFLRETKKETEKNIKKGTYKLINLN
jgi:hypothetical protein